MKKILIGNWKMNPKNIALASKIFLEESKLLKNSSLEIVICPPSPFISSLNIKNSKIKLGAQDVSKEKAPGAYTGETLASQLKSVAASFVIVGHSERRALGDTSAIVASKALNAISAQMNPIICVGEKERHSDGAHWQVISHELRASLSGIPKSKIKNCIIAYEPIWAIGSHSKGAMTPEDASESAIFIKKILSEIYGSASKSTRVVYGGSVDFKNAGEIAKMPGISGLLVGRDSLVPKHFAKIAESLK